jgi:NitT/TauT family transport system substrate-binding protein
VAIALLAGLAMASLSACAGGAGGKISPGSDGKYPVKIGYTAPGAGYSDLYVAADYGIFAKHGLNAQLVRLNDSSQLVAGLASGSVQIGVGVTQDSAAAILKGANLKYVAMSEPHYNLEMWADPSIKSVQGLKGKKVAITSPGSESDYGLTDLLKNNGMIRNDVTTVYVKGVPAEVSALESHAVSAILTQPPQGTQSRQKGAVRLAELSSLDFPIGSYTTQSRFLDNNREVVKRFVAADADALQFLRTHEAETEKSIEKYTGVTNPALAKYAYDFFLNVWAQDPKVDQRLIQQAFQEAAQRANVPPPPDVSKYIDNTLLPNP